MAFNLGAFASGVAQGGINTYKTLAEIESQKKRDELLDLQMAELRNKIEEERQIRQTGRDVFSQVGKEDVTGALSATTGVGQQQASALTGQTAGAGLDFESYDRDQMARTMRANAERQGVPMGEQMRPALPTYTREQAESDYANRVRAINYERGTAAEAAALGIQSAKQGLKKGGLEIKGLEREQQFNETFDATMKDWQKNQAFKISHDFDKTLVDEGVSGVLKKYGPEFKQATGNDVALVGNEIHVTNKGKIVDRFPTDQLQAKVEPMLAKKAMSGLMDTMVEKGLFRNPAEVLNFFKTQTELKNQGIQADAAMINALANQQRTPSEIAKNQATAGYLSRGGAAANRQTAGDIMKEKIDALATVYMKADPAMSRPDAEKRAAQVITRDPEAKAEFTASDLNNFLKDQAGVVVDKDKATGKPITLGQLPLDQQLKIARESLGRVAGAAPQGGMPDANPARMTLPGAGSTTTTAPKQAIPYSQQLVDAAKADAGRTDKFNFRQFSEQVVKDSPAMEARLKTLRSAIPSIQDPGARARLEAEANLLEQDLEVVPGILSQRKALGF
jgi:hypothetical protein